MDARSRCEPDLAVMLVLAPERPGEPDPHLQRQQRPEHLERDAHRPDAAQPDLVVLQMGEGDMRRVEGPVRLAVNVRLVRQGAGVQAGLGLGAKLGVVDAFFPDQQLLDQQADADAHQIGVVAAHLGHRFHQRAAGVPVHAQALLEGLVRQVRSLGQLGSGERSDPFNDAHGPLTPRGRRRRTLINVRASRHENRAAPWNAAPPPKLRARLCYNARWTPKPQGLRPGRERPAVRAPRRPTPNARARTGS